MAENEINKKKVLVIGGSAGSLEVVLNIVAALPPRTKSTIVIVLHRKSDADSTLAELVGGRSSLKVREVEDKDTLHSGVIYLAPPGYHLLVENLHSFGLDTSEKVQFSRPSIDVCFESAAFVFGSSVAGILLSGANADGVAGLASIKNNGGMVIVQDPDTAEVDYMPRQACANVNVDRVVPANELPYIIAALCL